MIDLYFDRAMALATGAWAARPARCDQVHGEERGRDHRRAGHSNVAERAGRAQDEGRGMELLRKDGYM